MERLSQTLVMDPSDYSYRTNFESVNVERYSQSDGEVGEKHRKEKKERKRNHLEYNSSRIDMDENIRLRLSRRNSCELLTQDSLSQGETLQRCETPESQRFTAVFDKLPVKRTTSATNLQDAEPTDAPENDNYCELKEFGDTYERIQTFIEKNRICENELQKQNVQSLYNRFHSFHTLQHMLSNLRQNLAHF